MRLFSAFIVAIAVIQPACVSACPQIGKFVDFNCDGKLKLTVTGDSIVAGRGDLDFNDSGGYVLRLERRLKLFNVVNMGVPGATTTRLFRAFKKNLRKADGKTTRKSKDADIFIVDVGVNDYFEHKVPGLTVRNIMRIVKAIRQGVARYSNSPPYIVVTTLTPTTREFQRGFIQEVNRLLIQYRSKKLPTSIRFDQLDPIYISFDGLHPTSDGYTQLADIADAFIEDGAQSAMSSQRPDTDQDGLYNFAERVIYGTDPRVADTDGDGESDGAEILAGTDPLTPKPSDQ
ncbi:MAG: hypothetical protein DCC75_06430 [Proteobacteria bacterium]|nr:MAG: hypothetical protein DCC75_06430 [Pseudomonadota bacterium]